MGLFRDILSRGSGLVQQRITCSLSRCNIIPLAGYRQAEPHPIWLHEISSDAKSLPSASGTICIQGPIAPPCTTEMQKVQTVGANLHLSRAAPGHAALSQLAPGFVAMQLFAPSSCSELRRGPAETHLPGLVAVWSNLLVQRGMLTGQKPTSTPYNHRPCTQPNAANASASSASGKK
ncbi:hypothetical protein Anapl_14397 [Anas platyrhynchos]|uniref:Uncharacterized protein n=1 Tax=Anas platyrhynchos TaxID=8839 RepID=R0KXM9_ANAPL|nr:hypothetical protein Anapl_14397 [Anas platyrhynchos]